MRSFDAATFGFAGGGGILTSCFDFTSWSVPWLLCAAGLLSNTRSSSRSVLIGTLNVMVIACIRWLIYAPTQNDLTRTCKRALYLHAERRCTDALVPANNSLAIQRTNTTVPNYRIHELKRVVRSLSTLMYFCSKLTTLQHFRAL